MKFLILSILSCSSLLSNAQRYFPFYNGEKWCIYDDFNENITVKTDYDSLSTFNYWEGYGKLREDDVCIAYKNGLEKLINSSDSILHDSLLNILHLGRSRKTGSNVFYDFYEFSPRSNPNLHGVIYPYMAEKVVPAKYQEYFLDGTEDNHSLIYMAGNEDVDSVFIYNIRKEQVIYDGYCTEIDFEPIDSLYYFLIHEDDRQYVINSNKEVILPKKKYGDDIHISYEGYIHINDSTWCAARGKIYHRDPDNRSLDVEWADEISSAYGDYTYDQGQNAFKLGPDSLIEINPNWEILDSTIYSGKERAFTRFRIDDKIGLFDLKNVEVKIEAEFDSIYTIHYENIYKCVKADTCTLYSGMTFNMISEYPFNNAWSMDVKFGDRYEDCLVVQYGNNFTILTMSGKIIVDNLNHLDASTSYSNSTLENNGPLRSYIFCAFRNGTKGYISFDDYGYVKYHFPN